MLTIVLTDFLLNFVSRALIFKVALNVFTRKNQNKTSAEKLFQVKNFFILVLSTFHFISSLTTTAGQRWQSNLSKLNLEFCIINIFQRIICNSLIIFDLSNKYSVQITTGSLFSKSFFQKFIFSAFLKTFNGFLFFKLLLTSVNIC